MPVFSIGTKNSPLGFLLVPTGFLLLACKERANLGQRTRWHHTWVGIQEGSSHEFSQKQDMPSWRRGYIFDVHCSPEQAEGLAPGFVFQMITY